MKLKLQKERKKEKKIKTHITGPTAPTTPQAACWKAFFSWCTCHIPGLGTVSAHA